MSFIFKLWHLSFMTTIIWWSKCKHSFKMDGEAFNHLYDSLIYLILFHWHGKGIRKTSTQWGQCFHFLFWFQKIKNIVTNSLFFEKQVSIILGKKKFCGKTFPDVENVFGFGTIFHHFSIIWTIKFYKCIAYSCYIFLRWVVMILE